MTTKKTQGNLGKDNLEALQNLQETASATVLESIPADFLTKAFKEADVELERVELLLDRVELDRRRVEQAYLAQKVVHEALRLMKNNPNQKYAQLSSQKESLEAELKKAHPTVGSVVIDKIKYKEASSNLAHCRRFLAAAELRVKNSLAQSYDFENWDQIDSIVMNDQSTNNQKGAK